MRIKQGIYRPKQAAILAYEQLAKHLNTHGYYPVIGTNKMFPHKTWKTKFCLCVDYFGIKYHSTDDTDHILHSLKYKYAITNDWEEKNFCGLTFDWKYKACYVDM